MTENAQPAILTTSIAMLRVLETEFGFDIAKACNNALGHSLGEYTALVATNALSLADAVRLVRLRGEAMTRAVADRKTAMSALVVRKDKLKDLLAAMDEIQGELPPNEMASVANINSVNIKDSSLTLKVKTKQKKVYIDLVFHASLSKWLLAAQAQEWIWLLACFRNAVLLHVQWIYLFRKCLCYLGY